MPDEPLPLLNNRFTVNIDSSRPDCSRRNIAFSSISAMRSSRSTSIRSSLMLKLFDILRRNYTTNQIELRRALDTDHFFFDWHRANLHRTLDLRTLTICQLDQRTGKPVNCWRLYDCWIHTWLGPGFDAVSSDITYETITLCYRSLNWLNNSHHT